MPRRAIPRWAPDVERLRSTGLSPGTEQGVQRRGQLDSQVADIVDGFNCYGSGAGWARSGVFDAGRAEEMHDLRQLAHAHGVEGVVFIVMLKHFLFILLKVTLVS